MNQWTRIVGPYAFAIKAAEGRGWDWIVTHKGEKIAAGNAGMHSLAEVAARTAIAKHSKEN